MLGRSAELSIIGQEGISDLAEGSLPSCRDAKYTGKIFRVDPSGKMHFRTVQAAINAASENDRIFVHGGRYNESIQITQQVTLLKA